MFTKLIATIIAAALIITAVIPASAGDRIYRKHELGARTYWQEEYRPPRHQYKRQRRVVRQQVIMPDNDTMIVRERTIIKRHRRQYQWPRHSYRPPVVVHKHYHRPQVIYRERRRNDDVGPGILGGALGFGLGYALGSQVTPQYVPTPVQPVCWPNWKWDGNGQYCYTWLDDIKLGNVPGSDTTFEIR